MALRAQQNSTAQPRVSFAAHAHYVPSSVTDYLAPPEIWYPHTIFPKEIWYLSDRQTDTQTQLDELPLNSHRHGGSRFCFLHLAFTRLAGEMARETNEFLGQLID